MDIAEGLMLINNHLVSKGVSLEWNSECPYDRNKAVREQTRLIVSGMSPSAS